MPRITCAGSAPTKSWLPFRKWNDYAAKIQDDHKGKLYSFATILPCGGPAILRETERAIRELGLEGVFIHSSHKGSYPDDDEARPFWELVQDLDVPVMIHPPNVVSRMLACQTIVTHTFFPEPGVRPLFISRTTDCVFYS